MNLKLENQRQVIVHTVDVEVEADPPPDAVIWETRLYRYVRTDGVWDQKKHVYREATVLTLADQNGTAAPETDEAILEIARTKAEAEARERAEGARQFTLTLTAKQSEKLRRVREQGGYPNFKAVLLAGLEAIEKGAVLNNDALLALLAKRLRGARADAA